MSMSAITLSQALCVAESLLGRRPGCIRALHPVVGGDDSHGFRLWAGNEAMLLKINKRVGTPIGVYFHGRLKEAGLPVPELIAFDSNGGPHGQACTIWEWVDGEPAGWGLTSHVPMTKRNLASCSGAFTICDSTVRSASSATTLRHVRSLRIPTLVPSVNPGQDSSVATALRDATTTRGTLTGAKPASSRLYLSVWAMNLDGPSGACCTWATSCTAAT